MVYEAGAKRGTSHWTHGPSDCSVKSCSFFCCRARTESYDPRLNVSTVQRCLSIFLWIDPNPQLINLEMAILMNQDCEANKRLIYQPSEIYGSHALGVGCQLISRKGEVCKSTIKVDVSIWVLDTMSYYEPAILVRSI